MSQKLVRASFSSLKKLLRSISITRKLLYDLRNQDDFSDLYEHERMIADKVRVDNYQKAISRNVRPGQVVIDLGTGTGILALLAAKQGAKHVYAIDHSEFLDVAKYIAKQNQIENVTFVNINSRDFTPPEKVDVILHEQIGDDLFEENMLENLLDLKSRVLKENGRILPAKFELYLEPVSIRDPYHIPFLWERTVHGLDFSSINAYEGIERYKSDRYHTASTSPLGVDFFLCEPEPIISFDMNNMNSPAELAKEFEVRRKVIRDGRLDGLFLYFTVIFDDETQFDTSPLSTRTHWENRLFRFPGRKYKKGDELCIQTVFKDFTRSSTWDIKIK